ncbi:MAG: hypothetical protein ACLRZN_03755 [Dialister invisus]
MQKVELDQLIPQMETMQNWGTVLSPGEQQRLSLGRLWLQKPDWAFLDEALSSVDLAGKERILCRLRDDFPAMGVLGIEHYSEHMDFYDRILRWEDLSK